MSKQNSAECQFAINMFKATEMSMKKLLDLLEKTVEQKKSFRSLSLMINKIKGQETELKKLLEEVMRQQPHQSTASSILNRQTALITRLNELELRVDLLDDDGQLSQSSSRIRDDVSMISSRRNLSRQSTPAPSDDKERIQHQRDIEEKQTSSNIFTQPPHYHHGQDTHHCFYKHLMNQDFKFSMCLKPTKEILKRKFMKVF